MYQVLGHCDLDLFSRIIVSGAYLLYLYPRYEVYRGYIVFAFSVIMFVCLSVNFFFRQRFLSNYLG